MNHHINGIPSFDQPDDEREWLAQEQAMRRERVHPDSLHDDARSNDYRLLATALREPLSPGLPSDFAKQVAFRATATFASSARFEYALMVVLMIIMMITAGMVMFIYGSYWMQTFSVIATALKQPGGGWLLAFNGCVVASWFAGQGRREVNRG